MSCVEISKLYDGHSQFAWLKMSSFNFQSGKLGMHHTEWHDISWTLDIAASSVCKFWSKFRCMNNFHKNASLFNNALLNMSVFHIQSIGTTWNVYCPLKRGTVDNHDVSYMVWELGYKILFHKELPQKVIWPTMHNKESITFYLTQKIKK